MDSIRTAVLCGCFAALGLTLAGEIIPAERFQRELRLLLSLIIVTAILRPLAGLHLPAPDAFPEQVQQNAEQYAEQADALRTEAIRETVQDALNRSLSEQEVACTVEWLDLHIDESGSIIINEAVISGSVLTGRVFLREWLGEDVLITEKEVSP